MPGQAPHLKMRLNYTTDTSLPPRACIKNLHKTRPCHILETLLLYDWHNNKTLRGYYD